MLQVHRMSQPTADRPLLSENEILDECYEIRRLLGAGAMGQVYEAHDRELNRLVAIKVCRPGVDAEQLRREARIMAAFQHPGLTAVYNLGVHRGMSYAVMERLRGRSMASHLNERLFSAGETWDILLSTAESLSVLHRANLVHRDLKPANVMLVPPRRVVLLDFGICEMEQFVPQKALAGSLHYIAPEVATGQVRAGDAHLIDVYALGVIGFQMLTGRMPYLSATVAQLMGDVVTKDVPSIATLRPGVHPPLAELIQSMLARNPAERPATIDVVATQLRAMLVSGVFDRPHGHSGAANRSRATWESGFGDGPAWNSDTGAIARSSQATTSSELPGHSQTGSYNADLQRTDESLDRIRILVADDEPAIWSLMSYVLEEQGYEIVFVEEGERALAEFEKQPFEIVITDKNMPKMDGVELLREVKKRRPSTDVVLITGYPSRQAVRQSIEGGAVSLIEKPFDIDEMAETVARLAKRQRALRASAALVS